MEIELSALYIDPQGRLCINFGTTPVIVDGFGTSVFGDYFVYTSKKSKN
jgi:hypothetical protein